MDRARASHTIGRHIPRADRANAATRAQHNTVARSAATATLNSSSNDETKLYLDSLTSEFRELLVNLEQENQDYRNRLAEFKVAKSQLERRERDNYRREYSPSRIAPAAAATSVPRTSATSSNLATVATSSSSSSVATARIRALYKKVCQHLQRQQRSTMAAPRTRGALIVLEGLDRVGKSTLAENLHDHFDRLKKPVRSFRFPDRTTKIGQLIHEILQRKSEPIDNRAVHLLFTANRWEWAKKIRNTIDEGITVILDRYAYSGIAYSAAKKGISIKWCSQMEQGLPRPDLVIYLELGREAQQQRPGFGGECFENSKMQDGVRLQYQQVMDMSEETWLRVNVEGKGPQEVLEEVKMPVRRCLESCATKELGELKFIDV